MERFWAASTGLSTAETSVVAQRCPERVNPHRGPGGERIGRVGDYDLEGVEGRIGAEGGGQLGVMDFERDRPVVPYVVRKEHRRHAAASELPLEHMPASQP